MKYNHKILLAMLILLLFESIYFDIVYDVLLIVFFYLTVLSVGSFITIKGRFQLIDKLFLQLASGFAIVGCCLWFSTFYNYNYLSLYSVSSILLIVFRRKQLAANLKYSLKVTSRILQHNRLLIFLLTFYAIFYIAMGSYPIGRSDASVKHLSIPFNILNKTNWDYNIIEGTYFSETALLSHMYSLYLLALKGTKAISLFVSSISFITLLMLLRISIKIDKSNRFVNAIASLYFTTPIIIMFTTSLFCDIFPVYFIAAVLLFISCFRIEPLINNNSTIAFLMGAALFSKQSALYFVLPLLAIIVCWSLYHFLAHTTSLSIRCILTKVLISSLLFCLPFVPAIILVWHKTGNPLFPFENGVFKSIYFTAKNFVDGRWEVNPIGFNLHSFFSLIFHTSKHWEWPDGGLGYSLLLFLPAPILLFKRNKTYIFLTVFSILSFWISTYGGSNARYKLGFVVFSMPICAAVLLCCVNWIKNSKIRSITFHGLLLCLIAPNVHYILTPKWLGFSPKMLIPNKELTAVENEAILYPINKKGVRLLSNNDPARGCFKGEFYTLTWYNTFLVNKLITNEVSLTEFIEAYDYYLVRKDQRYLYPDMFSPDKPDMTQAMLLVDEDNLYKLYKINKKQVPIISEDYKSPVIVTIDKHETRQFDNHYRQYRIIIEADKVTPGNADGRFQINWVNNGKYQCCSIEVFKLKEGRNTYSSEIIKEIPPHADRGVLFLTSHDHNPIQIHSFKLIGISKKNDYLSNELSIYNKKWPHLSDYSPSAGH